jgi:hypothetical protein
VNLRLAQAIGTGGEFFEQLTPFEKQAIYRLPVRKGRAINQKLLVGTEALDINLVTFADPGSL